MHNTLSDSITILYVKNIHYVLGCQVLLKVLGVII